MSRLVQAQAGAGSGAEAAPLRVPGLRRHAVQSSAPEHSRDPPPGATQADRQAARSCPSLGRGGLGSAVQPAPARTAVLTRLPSLNGPTVTEAGPCSCAPAMHHASWVLLPLMGATRDGCFFGKTNVCEPPHLCHSPKRRAHDWPAGPRTSDCLPPGSPRLGGARWPPCLWCCHLPWVCLRPGACWKRPSPHCREPP